jgi:hypothetical protein
LVGNLGVMLFYASPQIYIIKIFLWKNKLLFFTERTISKWIFFRANYIGRRQAGTPEDMTNWRVIWNAMC